MLTPAQTAWHERVEAELGNLRAALAWLEEAGDAERMQTLAAACWWALVDRSSAREAREWLDRALALPQPGSPETRAVALVGAGFTALIQGDVQALGTFAEAGLALSRAEGFPLYAGLSLFLLAQAASECGDYARAASIGDEAIALLRQAGDRRWLAMALNDIGLHAALSGNPARADRLHEEGLALSRAVGSTWPLAIALSDSASKPRRAAIDMWRSIATARAWLCYATSAPSGTSRTRWRVSPGSRPPPVARTLRRASWGSRDPSRDAGDEGVQLGPQGQCTNNCASAGRAGRGVFAREFALGRRLAPAQAVTVALALADEAATSRTDGSTVAAVPAQIVDTPTADRVSPPRARPRPPP